MPVKLFVTVAVMEFREDSDALPEVDREYVPELEPEDILVIAADLDDDTVTEGDLDDAGLRVDETVNENLGEGEREAVGHAVTFAVVLIDGL